jgi:hypothetical protein
MILDKHTHQRRENVMGKTEKQKKKEQKITNKLRKKKNAEKEDFKKLPTYKTIPNHPEDSEL